MDHEELKNLANAMIEALASDVVHLPPWAQVLATCYQTDAIREHKEVGKLQAEMMQTQIDMYRPVWEFQAEDIASLRLERKGCTPFALQARIDKALAELLKYPGAKLIDIAPLVAILKGEQASPFHAAAVDVGQESK